MVALCAEFKSKTTQIGSKNADYWTIIFSLTVCIENVRNCHYSYWTCRGYYCLNENLSRKNLWELYIVYYYWLQVICSPSFNFSLCF
jgi:hypothetical protein